MQMQIMNNEGTSHPNLEEKKWLQNMEGVFRVYDNIGGEIEDTLR